MSELYRPARKQVFTWHLPPPQQHLFQDPHSTPYPAWPFHPGFPFKICCHSKEFLHSLMLWKTPDSAGRSECPHSSHLEVLPLTLEGVFSALNPLAAGSPRGHLQTEWWAFLLQLPWFLRFGCFDFTTSKQIPVLNRWYLPLPSSHFTPQLSSPPKDPLLTLSFKFTHTQEETWDCQAQPSLLF